MREHALHIFEQYNPYGIPLKNHCERLRHFTLELAKNEGIEADRDLVFAGAYLHDIGLLIPNDDCENYLYRGAAFAKPLIKEWGLNSTQEKQMTDMLLYNHSFKSIKGISPIGEMMRQAVQVEHSLGRWTHGLNKSFIQKVFTEVPRKGLNHVLTSFTKTSLKRDGVKEIYRLFFPKVNKAT